MQYVDAPLYPVAASLHPTSARGFPVDKTEGVFPMTDPAVLSYLLLTRARASLSFPHKYTRQIMQFLYHK